MVLIYVLTLAIFPGVLAEDVSNSNLGSWRALHTLHPRQGRSSAAPSGRVMPVESPKAAAQPMELPRPTCSCALLPVTGAGVLRQVCIA